MGVATLLGRPQGFFIPYRYAGRVVPPSGYPELARVFEAAEPAMRGVLEAVARHAGPLAAFDGPPPEPRWTQTWFPRLDGAAAYALLRDMPPARVIEVGSGHSTRFMARALADAGGGGRITCIDPEPRAALAGLPVDWRREVLAEAHLPLFATLSAGDVAFFDSSHLLWPGTDVDMILNRILPALAPGVRVHLHDIFLPKPYPADWAWRGYTEQQGLGGWLAGGGVRVLFSSVHALCALDAANAPGMARLPLPEGAHESSLWLERT